MKAVFLDRNTFSPSIELPAPEGVTDWQVFDATANDTATVVARLQGAQIAITNKVLMTRDILAQLPDLRLIQITATGVNNVDAAACEEHGVKLFNVAGYSTTTVPEHTFAMMLAAMRGLLPYHQAVVSGEWRRDGRFCLNELPILDLRGKTLGIVGVGNIGKRVTEIARVFGMHVLWAERRHAAPRSPEYTPFESLWRRIILTRPPWVRTVTAQIPSALLPSSPDSLMRAPPLPSVTATRKSLSSSCLTSRDTLRVHDDSSLRILPVTGASGCPAAAPGSHPQYPPAAARACYRAATNQPPSGS